MRIRLFSIGLVSALFLARVDAAPSPAQSALAYQVISPTDGHVINLRFGIDSNRQYNLVFPVGTSPADQAYILSLTQFNNYGYSGTTPLISFGNTINAQAQNSNFPQAESIFINNELWSPMSVGSGEPLYSAWVNGGAVTRNAGIWIGSALDLTALSVYTSGSANFDPVAISPMHLLVASHVTPAISSTVTFLDSTGALITATVLFAVQINDPTTGNATDLTVLTLQTPLPATVIPWQLMPADWATNVIYGAWQLLPSIQFNLNARKVTCAASGTDTRFFGLGGVGDVYTSYVANPPLAARQLLFYIALVSGDSSSPFCFVNTSGPTPTIALVGLASEISSNSSLGTDAAFYTPQIQAIMDADFIAGRTAAHYFVQTSNFSAFK